MNDSKQNDDEKLPLHDYYQLIEYHTIRKTSQWWSAAVLFKDKFRRKRIGLYLWHKENSEWKRKHKYVINSKEEFKTIINIVKYWIPEI